MKLTRHILAMSCLIAVACAKPAAAEDTQEQAITYDTMIKVTEHCVAFAAKNHIKVSIAIYNHEGNMILFITMPDASLASRDIAKIKAKTAIAFGRSTASLAELFEQKPALATIPGMLALEGGEIIYSDTGKALGSVGVSGATSTQDAECAQVGIAGAQLRYDL